MLERTPTATCTCVRAGAACAGVAVLLSADGGGMTGGGSMGVRARRHGRRPPPSNKVGDRRRPPPSNSVGDARRPPRLSPSPRFLRTWRRRRTRPTDHPGWHGPLPCMHGRRIWAAESGRSTSFFNHPLYKVEPTRMYSALLSTNDTQIPISSTGPH
jgi:hypothetical protein